MQLVVPRAEAQRFAGLAATLGRRSERYRRELRCAPPEALLVAAQRRCSLGVARRSGLLRAGRLEQALQPPQHVPRSVPRAIPCLTAREHICGAILANLGVEEALRGDAQPWRRRRVRQREANLWTDPKRARARPLARQSNMRCGQSRHSPVQPGALSQEGCAKAPAAAREASGRPASPDFIHSPPLPTLDRR